MDELIKQFKDYGYRLFVQRPPQGSEVKEAPWPGGPNIATYGGAPVQVLGPSGSQMISPELAKRLIGSGVQVFDLATEVEKEQERIANERGGARFAPPFQEVANKLGFGGIYTTRLGQLDEKQLKTEIDNTNRERELDRRLTQTTGFTQTPQRTLAVQNPSSLSESGGYYKIGNDVFESGTNRRLELPEFKQLGLNFALLPEGKPQRSLSESGNYYKVGNDVFESSTGRKLELPEFKSLGLNFALLPEGRNNALASQSQSQNFAQAFDQGLQNLYNKGFQINPNLDLSKITPEKIAEFMRIAETEISPFYKEQLRIARGELLRSQGYSRKQLDDFEQDLERQYGETLTQVGESLAERGLAQSGQRLKQERDLAEGTQRQLERQKLGFQYGQGTQALNFAQQFGTSELPQQQALRSIGITPGEAKFRTIGETPYYNLDDNLLANIKGSQQFAEEAAKRNRTSELESLYRTQQNLSPRQLTI